MADEPEVVVVPDTMIVAMQKAIITCLETAGFKNVLGWSGDVNELLEKPKTLPAFRVVYAGRDLAKPETMGKPLVHGCTSNFTIVVFFRSLVDKGDGVYTYIDSIMKALDGHKTTYGDIVYKSDQLLYHKTYDFVYSCQVAIHGRVRSNWNETDVLVKQIVIEEVIQ